MKISKIYLPDVVGKGYKEFWNYKGRYRVCKGGRASKKSKTTALNFITRIMEYPESNLLVVRKTFRTLKDSCFTELKWAIHRLCVDAWWEVKESPLEMTYKPTGQKIYFRGLDDPLKVTSITVDVGVLCWMWIEEAYEILNEEHFDTLDESIRGTTPIGLFKQITLTFNPWSEHHWLKKRFFDVVDDEVFAITTTYKCNEWLDEHDLKLFEDMKINRPKRYAVAGLGEWGVDEGLIFDNWSVEDLTDLIPTFSNIYNGMDFGVTDPNTIIRANIEQGQKKIYVFDEYYQSNVTLDILTAAVQTHVPNGFITCDCAGKQNILELNKSGVNAIPSVKGAGSVQFGIQWLKGYDIVIHKDCKHLIEEMSNYQWSKDKFGNTLDVPVDKNNHCIDALRYATEPLQLMG